MDDDLRDDDGRSTSIMLTRAAELFYLCLAVTGVIIYWGYSLLYDAWTDVGIITVSLPFIAFGVVGLILYRLRREEIAASEDV